MKKVLTTTVLIILCFFLCPKSYGQNLERNQINSTKNYNIPPGVVFSNKFNTNLDLSYKLNGTPNLQSYHDDDLRVGKRLTQEQLDSLKEKDVANYNYYTTANLYFQGLSKKIKEIYTDNELWYIYVFDQKLKNNLLTIK